MNELAQQIESILKKQLDKLPPSEMKLKKQMLEKLSAGGANLQEYLQITPDMAEYIYEQGRRQYIRKNYPKAVSIFRMLYSLNPEDPRYTLGLAGAMHMMGNFEDAKLWYIYTDQLAADDNPMIPYHLSDCYEKTGAAPLGLIFLRMALERCKDDEKFASFKERIKLLIKSKEAA